MHFLRDPTVQAVSYPYQTDRKRRKLRVAIVTENFLPKIDGVTRTLARLLEHLHAEGHEAMVLGPETGISEYMGHPVVGTFGVPLVVYPGLKLNFARLRFVRRLQQFRPDVVHFVDPIWLGAQMMYVVKHVLPGVPCVSSYHTNLPTYASLFGIGFLEAPMWGLIRSLHNQCEIVFCPSESTRRMLIEKGFKNVEIWGRGVDIELFNPGARDENLRASWGCKPKSQALLDTLHRQAVSTVKASMRHRKSDAEFIRTPNTLPATSPELSPPPSYDSINDIPPISMNSFALPPPVIPSASAAPVPQETEDSKAVVLYVGRISWEKNIRLLIEAFRLLPAAVRENAKLVIVGDGPARAELTRLCAKYGLDAAFMGHQRGKRLASMFASSSIFGFPSFTETFGQVVLEALASGLPVVGLHAEGTSDLVSHGVTGLLLDVQRAIAPTSSPQVMPASPTTAPSDTRENLALLPRRMSASTDRTSISSGAAVPTAAQSAAVPGLPTPLLSVKEYAAVMTHGTRTFQQCAQAYSILLERLIRDRTLRSTMGQRAQQFAANRTWWDAMDAPVRGYERVVETAGTKNLTDSELEALRNMQFRTAPFTGPVVKLMVALYLVCFVILWTTLI
ncbi:hypothetical protein MCUN1_000773 [Malassezia cuniculi]|uniref:GDP-mannose-dependent alpha-mannosyltransferase n=1 Tax=Malassezia cuniculi TaxID=948313 RepID=A0AAF0J5D6_9BASI|nr:hypothetical protein MCUN1_000773 [Malassezia cuniculi]